MIHHDPMWLCLRRTRLYINYLGKVYEENEWRRHFRNPSCDVTAQLYWCDMGTGLGWVVVSFEHSGHYLGSLTAVFYHFLWSCVQILDSDWLKTVENDTTLHCYHFLWSRVQILDSDWLKTSLGLYAVADG